MKTDIKIIGVISSAREGSNTAAMVREALKGAAENGASVTELFLPAYKLDFCTGCLSCVKTGACCLQDGFNGLREQLYAADGIIWGAPTYAALPNAIMKNLIDRLGIYEAITSSLGSKYMAGISAANSPGAAKKTAKGLARFGIGGTYLRSFSSGYLGAGFRGGKKAADDIALLAKARKLGAKVAADIRGGNRYPLQGLSIRILTALITRPVFNGYILKNKDADTKTIYESLRRRNLVA